MNKKALPKIILSSSKGFLAVSTLTCALVLSAHAATLGHARLVQSSEHAFDVQIPINNVSDKDEILAAQVAPLEQWQANGLKPPVALDSIRVYIQKTANNNSLLRVVSEQPYSDSIVDLLLYIKTPSGYDPFQVSIVAPTPKQSAVQKTATSSDSNLTNNTDITNETITVKSGDTMFAIARQNSVQDVSLYQLMMALQRANPQAFIKNNINLVKAGAELKVPSIQAMLSISDAEARRQFVAQTQALNSNSAQASDSTDGSQSKPSQGQVSYADSVTEPPITGTNNDVVKLGAADKADDAVSQQHALKEAKVRVSQLENNVKNLNQALRSQGKAASEAVTDSAKAINESFNQLADSLLGDDGPNEQGSSTLLADNIDGSSDNTGTNNTADTPNLSANESTSGSGSGSESHSTKSLTDSASGANTSNVANDSEVNQTRPGINVPVKAASGTNGASDQTLTKPDSAVNTTGSSANADATSTINSESSWLAWIKNHLFGFVTSVLALIVLILVWFLRRMNASKDNEPMVTDQMLNDKLNNINLDLDSDNPSK